MSDHKLTATQERLAAAVRRGLARAAARPPLEGFEELVRRGFINRKGQVTRLIGGTAEPEPGITVADTAYHPQRRTAPRARTRRAPAAARRPR